MAAKKRKTYMKYPKVLTVTCVSCDAVFDVLLKDANEFRKRFYCSEKCEAEYHAAARRGALASRKQNGKFGGERGRYQDKTSTVLNERTAATAATPKRRKAEDIAREAKEAEQRRRDSEYWAALRLAMGITAEAMAE